MVVPGMVTVLVDRTSLVTVIVDGGGTPVDGEDPEPLVPVPIGRVPVGPVGWIPLPVDLMGGRSVPVLLPVDPDCDMPPVL